MIEARKKEILDRVAEGIKKAKKEVERVERAREEAKHIPLGHERIELRRSVITAIRTCGEYRMLICQIARELIGTGKKLDELEGIKELKALLTRLDVVIEKFRVHEGEAWKPLHEKLEEEIRQRKEIIEELEEEQKADERVEASL